MTSPSSPQGANPQSRVAELEERLAAEHGLLNHALDRCNELSGEVLAERTARQRMREALEAIEAWDSFPPSGRTWEDGTPMSYGAAFGSNGQRDYMRAIARRALDASGECGAIAERWTCIKPVGHEGLHAYKKRAAPLAGGSP